MSEINGKGRESQNNMRLIILSEPYGVHFEASPQIIFHVREHRSLFCLKLGKENVIDPL